MGMINKKDIDENKESLSTLKIIIEIINSIGKKEQRKIIPISILCLISGLSETLSLSLILPLIQSIANPNNLLSNPYIISLGINNQLNLILISLIIFLIGLIVGTTIRIYSVFIINQWAAKVGQNISLKILKNLLNQNYEYHINNDSGDFIYTITTDTTTVSRCLRLLANSSYLLINALTIILGLFIFKPFISVYLFTTISISYILGAKLTKNILNKTSFRNAKFSRTQLKILRETLGGIKETLLSKNIQYKLNIFKDNDTLLKKTEVVQGVASELPRILIEAIMLLTICSLLIFIYFIQKDTNALFTIGTFSLGSLKMLSSLSRIYGDITIFRVKRFSLIKVLKLLNLNNNRNWREINPKKKNSFNNQIELNNISFSYKDRTNNATKIILNKINFKITKNKKVGIIGKTGSGKSTLIDLIIGLLEPTEGKIIIDGIDLNKLRNLDHKISWMKSISYVPQNIYLYDLSIKENIIQGHDESHEINTQRFNEICKISHVYEFVRDKKNGYETLIGEKGVKLSGGQKQRLGLARALYKNSDVLILDEATSALDNKTEKDILQKISLYRKDLTIIMITHRENTLVGFDEIIRIEKGEIQYQ
tara:strand:- start:42614 stop:44404 length:1791 start_codon:yes stop_codon:yes gene_type:complete